MMTKDTKFIDIIKLNNSYKKCNRCQEIKILTDYSIARVDGRFRYYFHTCRLCRNEKEMERYNKKNNIEIDEILTQ